MIGNILKSIGLAPAPKSTGRRKDNRQSKPTHHHRPHSGGGNRKGTDLIGVIGFHDKAFPISLPAEPWGNKLGQRVRTLPNRIGGATDIAGALRLALDMSRKCPKGSRRRIWLLSDGDANINVQDAIPAARAIAKARINLNVVAFGEAANSQFLKTLAAQTHNGKFVSVHSLQQMSAALKRDSIVKRKSQHRQEVAILCVDCSYSMTSGDMGGMTRIEAVRDAIQALCSYKAQVWG